MDTTARSPSVMLRLVSSTGEARSGHTSVAQRSHLRLVVDDAPRQQLLRTMMLVATARTHAASRIRARLQVGRGLSISLVLGLAMISLCQGLFADTLGVGGHRSLAILSLLAVISLLLLVRHSADERAISAVHDLESCIGRIRRLIAELRQGSVGNADLIHDVRRRYIVVLRDCRARHKHADYLAAKGSLDRAIPHPWRARLHYVADVYLREIAIAAVPLLLFVTL